jgi:hypothetical protein
MKFGRTIGFSTMDHETFVKVVFLLWNLKQLNGHAKFVLAFCLIAAANDQCKLK